MTMVGAPSNPSQGFWKMPPSPVIAPGRSSPELHLSDRAGPIGTQGDITYVLHYADIEYCVGFRFSDPFTGNNEGSACVTIKDYADPSLPLNPGMIRSTVSARSGEDEAWARKIPQTGHPLHLKYVVEEATSGTIMRLKRLTGKKLSELDDETYLITTAADHPFRLPVDAQFKKFKKAGDHWDMQSALHLSDTDPAFDLVIKEYDPVSPDDRLGAVRIDPAKKSLTTYWSNGELYTTDFNYDQPSVLTLHSFKLSNRDTSSANEFSRGLPDPSVESTYDLEISFSSIGT